ncbi:MAG: hypothetical protein ACK6DC_05170, partial [Planctomycetota bacterium]
MQEVTLATALLQGWSTAAYRPIDDALVGSLLRWVGQGWPFRSAVVYHLDPASKSMLAVGVTGPSAISVSRQPVPCTDSKWQELEKWLDAKEVLRQNSPRRSGKLALLAPESFSESIAIPLATDRDGEELGVRGALVFEIERGRLAQPS